MRTSLTILLVSILTLTISAQSVGPDVTVSDLTDVGAYGQALGITAFAVGTTACNVGSQPVMWTASNNQHPVIAQNMYRYLNGTFQQVGQSWLKHGFGSTNSPGCGSCVQPPLSSGQLGIGCTDAYVAFLNGSQSLLGPRSEVNAATGAYPWPHSSPSGDSTIKGRLQVANSDLGNAGARYFVEAQYVTADDALAGNKDNNATWQEIVPPLPGANGTVSFATGSAPHSQQPAIYAWQVVDPAVVINTVDIPADGRFIIAKMVTSLGGGNYHYEIAVHNLNSDRSGGGFTVDFPGGTVITNPGFHYVPSHSGEPYINAAWAITNSGNSIHWACAHNYLANALRWGTMYTFWFDATAAAETNMAIDLFKPAVVCAADPVVPPSHGYTLNTGAAFDNPTLTTPLNGPTGDNSAIAVPIGFTFNFYGTPYTTVKICTNGFLNFGAAASTSGNTPLPNTGAPAAVVAGYWDNLITPPGTITYQTLGAVGSRRFVASWNGVGHVGATGTLESFKIMVDETTDTVTSSIISSADGGVGATRGIQNQAGTLGIEASYNTVGSAVASTSQTYTPFTVIQPSADLAITGNTGPNGVLTWNINSVARSSPVVLVASLDPGPLNLGPLGTLNVGLPPGLFVVLADGVGALQPANPADVTDWFCGDYQLSIPLGINGLPPGLTIYNQGVVISPASIPPPPNGSFHITDMQTIVT